MHKILVIDDSKELLEMLDFILKLNGHEVKTASEKANALHHILHFKPHIILLDVRLNGDDGRKLCKEIKLNAVTKPPFVFLLSASPELLLDYKSFYADGIIEKPFDIDTIIKTISQITIDTA